MPLETHTVDLQLFLWGLIYFLDFSMGAFEGGLKNCLVTYNRNFGKPEPLDKNLLDLVSFLNSLSEAFRH